ncbi:MAG: hypothetical protein R3342_05225 [Lutibacter sp.]|uniref:hypothetical protein n=1 Tax=Lutibacter sp. TaxID=1925666 RepID=UPI00299CFEEF|nr:hypothetical protein [Lutibacter sp.]MDX1828932.1 hypothetical protein [Lutibacter sp.]
MKIKIIGLLSFFLIGGIVVLNAQNKPCKVLKEGIQKEYIGKCKKGLANGNGVAKGINTYKGNFKKGLPNGKGILTFANGNVYNGQFKKGLMDGKGKLTFKVNGVDSVRVGIWREGKYIGKIKIPDYSVKWNRGVDRYSFRNILEINNSTINKVKIKFLQNGNKNVGITNIRLDGNNGNRIETPNYVGFENITFPFKCKINYTTNNKLKTSTYDVIFEFVINKPGEWEVILNN